MIANTLIAIGFFGLGILAGSILADWSMNEFLKECKKLYKTECNEYHIIVEYVD